MTLELGPSVAVGVDIQPRGSPLGRARYCLVVLSDDKPLANLGDATVEDIIRMAKQYQASSVAIDNVLELAKTQSELVEITRRLPPSCRLIQVTATPTGMKTLHDVALEHDLHPEPKMNPARAAHLCAQLAARGVGVPFPSPASPVVVTISRGRTFGAGGMSQVRYRRRICLEVMRVASRIRDRLHDRGLDYDLETKRARWGLERAKFTIFATREALYGVVRPIRGPDVHVTVEPSFHAAVQSPRTGRLALEGTRHHLIVGVDPGTVYGVAALDLNGSVVSLRSSREWNRANVVEFLSRLGRVLVVATDVHPAPLAVRKIAAALDAITFEPQQAITVAAKRELARQAASRHKPPLRIDDTHQRDALASALRAFFHYQKKFEQIEDQCKHDPTVPLEEAKALVVKGLSTSEALDSVESRTAASHPLDITEQEPLQPGKEDRLSALEQLRGKTRSQKEAIRRLEKQVLLSENEQLILRQRLDELEDELERMRDTGRLELMKTREVALLEQRLQTAEAEAIQSKALREHLQDEILSLDNCLKQLQRSALVLLKPLNALTRLSVSQGIRAAGIGAGDFVYVKNGVAANNAGVELLTRARVGAVVVGDLSEDAAMSFSAACVPVVHSSQVGLTVVRGFVFADKTKLKDIVESAADELASERSKSEERMLDTLLEDYRRERKAVFDGKGKLDSTDKS